MKLIRGVIFEELGPVSRDLDAPVTRAGRICCPLCYAGGRKDIGPFYVNRYFVDHLKKDHYRCECGWIGIVPGAHLTRSTNHGPGIPRTDTLPAPVPLKELSDRWGKRLI